MRFPGVLELARFEIAIGQGSATCWQIFAYRKLYSSDTSKSGQTNIEIIFQAKHIRYFMIRE
jgi:hypothetical protein